MLNQTVKIEKVAEELIMKLGKRIFVLCALCLGSVYTASAEDTTWNFNDSLDYSGKNWGNSINISQRGQNVEISAWADTNKKGKIQNGIVANNEHGLLAYNRDDVEWYEHTIDNVTNSDMLLFSFDQAVSLTGLNLGWGFDYQTGQSDISMAGFDSLPSLHGKTWSEVVSLATFSLSLANVSVGSTQQTGITTEAKYWLVGAYNSVFGTTSGAAGGNDGFKLLSLTTHSKEPTGEVSAPATGVLMAGLIAMFVYRRRDR
ncbi:hypothetical protein OPS25_02790 [Alteromonas ponticola]|uniref:PEP-CTERM sorting domain-containing protein n=1 Tax=Alteromonas aquimaris TaxID=2998417 RepID=A0ABT3P3T1_9ALTE|nr:exosortase-dependent surface protein XDP1 [Alteromonas aquimaris]MCW8107429.1 hypothetical protein [Alteromonas aquimaris]